MQRTVPDWRKQLTKGNFNQIRGWYVKNVYSCGNLYDAPDLIKRITGKTLNVKPYLSYLNEKYSELYGF